MLAEEGGGSAWWVSVRVQIELALVTSPPACPPQICCCNLNYICNFHIFGCSGREIPKCSLVQKCGWLLRRRKEGGTGSPILPFRCLEFSTVYLRRQPNIKMIQSSSSKWTFHIILCLAGWIGVICTTGRPIWVSAGLTYCTSDNVSETNGSFDGATVKRTIFASKL